MFDAGRGGWIIALDYWVMVPNSRVRHDVASEGDDRPYVDAHHGTGRETQSDLERHRVAQGFALVHEQIAPVGHDPTTKPLGRTECVENRTSPERKRSDQDHRPGKVRRIQHCHHRDDAEHAQPRAGGEEPARLSPHIPESFRAQKRHLGVGEVGQSFKGGICCIPCRRGRRGDQRVARSATTRSSRS